MGINQVTLGGMTKLDLTADTVSADSLLAGVTAHGADGEPITGLYEQYQVGDIYISTSEASPAARFGGTWTPIEDRFLLASGSTYTAGSSGGTATHKLTAAQLPVDYAAFSIRGGIRNGNVSNIVMSVNGGAKLAAGASYQSVTAEGSVNTENQRVTFSGSGAGIPNMPPYLAVYMWQRIE